MSYIKRGLGFGFCDGEKKSVTTKRKNLKTETKNDFSIYCDHQ